MPGARMCQPCMLACTAQMVGSAGQRQAHGRLPHRDIELRGGVTGRESLRHRLQAGGGQDLLVGLLACNGSSRRTVNACMRLAGLSVHAGCECLQSAWRVVLAAKPQQLRTCNGLRLQLRCEHFRVVFRLPQLRLLVREEAHAPLARQAVRAALRMRASRFHMVRPRSAMLTGCTTIVIDSGLSRRGACWI